MADEKPKIPAHISKFQKLSKKAKQMIATTDKHHRNAYDAAVEAVLMDKGYVNEDKLKDMKVREEFADKMADFYVGKAKQQFKVGKDAKFDELETELLMNAYAGTTRGQLKQYVKKVGKKFTFDHFNTELRPGLMKGIEENLDAATVGHFGQEHVGDIVKYTGAGKFLDAGKMTVQDAVGVLGQYENNGTVLEKLFKEKHFYKKQEKK